MAGRPRYRALIHELSQRGMTVEDLLQQMTSSEASPTTTPGTAPLPASTRAIPAGSGELPFDFHRLNGSQKSHLRRLLDMPPAADDPVAAAQQSIESLFSLLGKLVRFEHFVAICGAEDFPPLFALALLDAFTGHSEAEKAERVQVAAETLPDRREHPAYDRISERLREEMTRLSAASSMDALTEIVEPAMARELAKIAIGSSREAHAAQGAFLDRRSAKVPRGKGARGKTLVLTEGALRTIQDGEAQAQRLVGPKEEIQ